MKPGSLVLMILVPFCFANDSCTGVFSSGVKQFQKAIHVLCWAFVGLIVGVCGAYVGSMLDHIGPMLHHIDSMLRHVGPMLGLW